jgi:ABC-type nitrate/sulfonate/bicarbonate transport system permease component
MDCRSVVEGAVRPFWSWRIRQPIARSWSWVLGVLPILLTLALWAALTHGEAEERIISPVILPNPFEVVGSFSSLWFERALSRSAIISFLRVVIGFVVGAALALPIGIGMGAFEPIRAMFSPLALLFGYLPIPAIVPLTLSLFGIGELQKVMFLAIAFFVYLLPLVVKAIDDVDAVYLQTAFTLGASTVQAVQKVLVPIAWPDIFQALRHGFGVGWGYILLAEMVAAEQGLGNIIIVSQRRGPREHIYLVLAVITLIAFCTDRLWAWAGRRLFPYREVV